MGLSKQGVFGIGLSIANGIVDGGIAAGIATVAGANALPFFIGVGAVASGLTFLVYSCCVVSARADEEAERAFQEATA